VTIAQVGGTLALKGADAERIAQFVAGGQAQRIGGVYWISEELRADVSAFIDSNRIRATWRSK
jgi:hypothetical protein